MKAVLVVVLAAAAVALLAEHAQANSASDVNGVIQQHTAVRASSDKARCLLGVLGEAVKEVAKLAWVCVTSGPYMPVCAVMGVRQFFQDVGILAMECFSG